MGKHRIAKNSKEKIVVAREEWVKNIMQKHGL